MTCRLPGGTRAAMAVRKLRRVANDNAIHAGLEAASLACAAMGRARYAVAFSWQLLNCSMHGEYVVWTKRCDAGQMTRFATLVIPSVVRLAVYTALHTLLGV